MMLSQSESLEKIRWSLGDSELNLNKLLRELGELWRYSGYNDFCLHYIIDHLEEMKCMPSEYWFQREFYIPYIEKKVMPNLFNEMTELAESLDGLYDGKNTIFLNIETMRSFGRVFLKRPLLKEFLWDTSETHFECMDWREDSVQGFMMSVSMQHLNPRMCVIIEPLVIPLGPVMPVRGLKSCKKNLGSAEEDLKTYLKTLNLRYGPVIDY